MKTNSSGKHLEVWHKIVPETEADLWLERLSFCGPERTAVTSAPGKSSCRVEVYFEKRREAESLRKQFGGGLRRVPGQAWWLSRKRDFFLNAGGRFSVASDGEAIPARFKKQPRILVPAGIAFGTGEHATTAMCLRQLARVAPEGKWTMLDAGTGSGVLALAAALLGAKVLAFDFDPDSIRESKANAGRNPGIPKVRWRCDDIKKMALGGPYDLVAANLYADLLIPSLPKLKKAVQKKGLLILSGILKEQEASVKTKAADLSLRLERRLRRGKWICLVYNRV